jgi:hypothetical protein
MGNFLRSRWVASPLLLLGLVAVPACGGAAGLLVPLIDEIDFGGDDDDDSVVIESDPALDGWVESDGSADAFSEPFTGDRDDVQPGVGHRQLYSFDLAEIPVGRTILSAELRIFQAVVVGNPYGELGDVVVDHVEYGPSLDGGDYAGGTLTPEVGTLSSDPTFGVKTLDVTAEVIADRAAARTRSEFRLRFGDFDSSDDGSADYAQFVDSEGSTFFDRPVLVVRYE